MCGAVIGMTLSLLALMKIDYITGNYNTAFENLSKAKAIAEKIKSKEHLADIYFQYYRLYERQGNYREALKQHVTASAMQDSMIDLEKMNRIQSVSLNIERHIRSVRSLIFILSAVFLVNIIMPRTPVGEVASGFQ